MKLLSTWKATWRLIAFRPGHFSVFSALWVLGLSSRLLPGLVLQILFDDLSGAAPAELGLWSLLGLLAAAEMTRVVADWSRVYSEESFRAFGWALLRSNVVRGVFGRPCARGLTVAPGDALSRLRGDVMELADWPSWLPYLLGHAVFAAIAVAIMLSIQPLITLGVVLPLIAVVVLVQLSRDRALRYYHASRDATGAVTGFLGEILDAVQAIKVADAETDAFVVPHVVDTAFLLSGIAMVWMLDLNPFTQPWLIAKFTGLIAYILLGTIAIKRGGTLQIRMIALVGAVSVFAYIAGVAFTKSPFSWIAVTVTS